MGREMKTESNQLSVEQLFSSRLFCVPDYQRGYAWEEDQLNDFIEDITQLSSGRDHYAGTVVLLEAGPERARVDASGSHFSTVDVVDGQQRLTTIVLFLDAIRGEMATVPPLNQLAEGIRQNYIACTDEAGQPMYKLTLNRDCRDYFIESVLSDRPAPRGPTIESHRRLSYAKNFFLAHLHKKRTELGAAYEKWLKELRNKLVLHLKMTLYTVNDEADVGVMFEVLNDRGKPLSELEKVKNYLLFVASKLHVPQHDLPRKINATWTRIFENLMRANLTSSDDEDQLLRAHWLMAYDHTRRNWNGSKSIKAQFNLSKDDHRKLLDRVLRYVQTLADASTAYCDARNPLRNDAFAVWMDNVKLRRQIVRASEKLRCLQAIASFLPLLIAARFRSTSCSDYLALVKLCEKYAFRVFRLLEKRANTGQSSLFHVARLLYGGDGVPLEEKLSMEGALAHVRGYLLYYCSDSEFRDSFKLNDENDWYAWYGIKYFLYEYEEELAGGSQINRKWGEVEALDRERTIEHILPQTPNDPYWTERFNSQALRKWMHDVANLCLTYDNSSYGNKPFPQKKGHPGLLQRCYANSPLFSERELAHLDDWNEESLKVRRQKIVDWAAKRWAVEQVLPVKPDLRDEDADAVT
jgi:hypothetical protein